MEILYQFNRPLSNFLDHFAILYCNGEFLNFCIWIFCPQAFYFALLLCNSTFLVNFAILLPLAGCGCDVCTPITVLKSDYFITLVVFTLAWKTPLLIFVPWNLVCTDTICLLSLVSKPHSRGPPSYQNFGPWCPPNFRSSSVPTVWFPTCNLELNYVITSILNLTTLRHVRLTVTFPVVTVRPVSPGRLASEGF